MQFMIRGPQQGKTFALVEWARGHDDRSIIVHNQAEFRRLLQENVYDETLQNTRRMQSWQFLTVADAQHDQYRARHHDVSYGIDNLDLMLHRLLALNGPIEAVTANGIIVPSRLAAFR